MVETTIPGGLDGLKDAGPVAAMKKKTLIFSLLAIVALWFGVMRGYHSGYQRGYSEGTRDEKLRSATSYNKDATAEVIVSPRVVTLDNNMATISVTRATPVFKKTSSVNSIPVAPKP